MQKKLKMRLFAVTGVIVIVVVIVLAVVVGATAHKSITVAEAASGAYNNTKVQVTGKVVEGSYSFTGKVLTFSICDEEEGPNSAQLKVVYDKSVSSTFGTDTTAICTGTIDDQGVLQCTELVTKCPSKYETSSNALSVEQLLSYDNEKILGKPVKITGTVKAGSLKPAGQGERFIIIDSTSGKSLSVMFDGALFDAIKDGSTVVLIGSLTANNKFVATDVALEE